jgi:hypothetical protein
MMVDMQINGATRGRLITVGLAPAAALAAWGIERSLGADLVLKDGTSVGAGNVVLAAVIAGVAAWFVVRWIERHSSRPRAVWAFVGRRGWQCPASARAGSQTEPRPSSSLDFIS